jgi:hypothetical protein
MAVESIRAPIQEGDVAREHLFVTPREMALREMHSVREFDYLAQEIRSRAEALNDSRDLMAAGTFAPEIVGGSSVAGGLVILGDANLCGRGFGRWFGGLFRFARFVSFVASH